MPDGDTAPPALDVAGLVKQYGPVRALNDVSLQLRRGEIRALLGKNGAGKSTLVKVISGAEQPDSGTIRTGGEQVRWSSPAAAQAGGISVVHQELSLVPGLSVAENICLGRWPRRGTSGAFIDTKAVERMARRALELVGEPIPLWREAGRLSLAEQQLVEIAKAVVHEPRILILDEPTSSLNAREADTLLALVRRLAASGVSIIYVSHRMREIPLIADSVTVLRDGAEVATLPIGEASPSRVAELIMGDVDMAREPRATVPQSRSTRPLLSVRGLAKPHLLDDVSFDVYPGEVVGIAGLLGSGRSEILEAVFGARHDVSGQVSVAGREVKRRSPSRMLSLGVGMTSEDRRSAGIVPMLSVFENMLLSARGRVLPKVWLSAARERRIVAELCESLAVATSSPWKAIADLSGGNQQKVVIGRLLAANLKVLLLDEPTRGVDLHAKQQLYRLIRELAGTDVSVVFVSSELEELIEVCDRVLVLRDGRIVDEVPGENATPDHLLTLAISGENSEL
ncbi:sugar ABC transporter ATP-binding protein [Streptomyces sp. NPDC020917]|uniref:sugar ABC transporter ATP-binding protein n=1 Tax=Streptomyces sp. NPDC020917 TaxID=3365102 RepID=UPI0037B7B4A5